MVLHGVSPSEHSICRYLLPGLGVFSGDCPDACPSAESLLWLLSPNSLVRSEVYVACLKILLRAKNCGIADMETVMMPTLSSTVLLGISLLRGGEGEGD